MAGNISRGPCHLPEHYPLPWKQVWHHRKKLVRQWDTFPKQPHRQWAKEHGIVWVYNIPCYLPSSRKTEQYNRLLKTTLISLGDGTFKDWYTYLAKATWLVNTKGSTKWASHAHSELVRTVEGDKVHIKNMLGKTVWVIPDLGKGKPICMNAFAQGPGYM